MKKKKLIPIISLMVIGTFSLFSCSGDIITAPEVENQLVSQQEGIPADEINFIPWTREFSKQIRSLNKKVASTVLVRAAEGGTVGGLETYGHKVDIPAGALSVDTEITLSVHCLTNVEPCVGRVEFLPDTQFNSNVTITLSSVYLDYNGSPYDIKVVWTKSDGTIGWKNADNLQVDNDAETITFEIDHFTQYAWSL